ncbi:MAG: SAM-dependent chlorinase/fluorinase [Dehalococcoidia bacterium]
MAAARRVITLTTDFGTSDHYVAAMKGLILGINPDVTIVDVSHEVRPQQVTEGAFLLQAVRPCFPTGTVHVAVVDPGVGTERRALILATPHGLFVGPDNGVLSPALTDSARPRHSRTGTTAVPVPSGCTAIAITERRYLREPISATFHGRDIFAPVAAHLTLGVAPESFGEKVSTVLALPPFRARRRRDGRLSGRVIHIDRFGNLTTDIRAVDIGGGEVTVEIAGLVLRGLSKTYGQVDGLVALIGSSGYLEVALPRGSAAELLDVDVGAPVTVRPLVVRLRRHEASSSADPR